ncbi:MAG TPA: hypothetical protein VFS55_02395, partial [Dokdonella sp.]|nr:hypothetical protein [Dokdonella sp.]
MLLALVLGACAEKAPPPPATPAPAPAPADRHAASRAKALADGAQAARAIARSMGVQAPAEPTNPAGAAPPDAPDAEGYVELDWLKMMPAADLEALKHPPPMQHVGRLRMKQFGTYDTVADVTNRKI